MVSITLIIIIMIICNFFLPCAHHLTCKKLLILPQIIFYSCVCNHSRVVCNLVSRDQRSKNERCVNWHGKALSCQRVKLCDQMIKQLLNPVFVNIVICQCLTDYWNICFIPRPQQIIHLLATNKSRNCAQPRQ